MPSDEAAAGAAQFACDPKNRVLGAPKRAARRPRIVDPQIKLQREASVEKLVFRINIYRRDRGIRIVIVHGKTHSARAGIGGIRRWRNQARDSIESVWR